MSKTTLKQQRERNISSDQNLAKKQRIHDSTTAKLNLHLSAPRYHHGKYTNSKNLISRGEEIMDW